MAKLSDKIKVATDETRMLVLGTQVLLSVQFEMPFQNMAKALPRVAHVLIVAGCALLMTALVLLLWAPAYHRLAAGGQCRADVHQFFTKVTSAALLPLGLTLGIDIGIVTGK